jgi:hypothetical protein
MIVLPLGTGLQLYADPAACRESAREGQGTRSGMPQFTLRSLLLVTSLVAAVLTTGQAWGFEAAVRLTYVATFALLTIHSRGRIALTRWYAGVTGLLAAGGLAAI